MLLLGSDKRLRSLAEREPPDPDAPTVMQNQVQKATEVDGNVWNQQDRTLTINSAETKKKVKHGVC
jgi:hypothetical protein